MALLGCEQKSEPPAMMPPPFEPPKEEPAVPAQVEPVEPEPEPPDEPSAGPHEPAQAEPAKTTPVPAPTANADKAGAKVAAKVATKDSAKDTAKAEPSTPSTPSTQPTVPSAAPEKPSEAPKAEPPKTAPPPPSKVTIPQSKHLKVSVPARLQSLLDADPRMQPWLNSTLTTIEQCYAAERAKSPDAQGTIKATLTMHANARPDADVDQLPPALSGVLACATGKLMRAPRMPLFTGKEGERHSFSVTLSP
jgi:hypothetical protein